MQVPGDAGDEVVADAGGRDAAVVRDHPRPSRDGGVIAQRSDARVDIDPNSHRGTIAVQVVTKPDTARLFVGTTYRGPGGVTLEEAAAPSRTSSAARPATRPPRCASRSTARTEVVLCAMQRIKICIDNIKNPFDDCEVDPSRPSPDHSMGSGSGSGPGNPLDN